MDGEILMFDGKPNPGSDEALDKGCKCPRYDNGFGKGSYKGTGFIVSADCPLHDWEEYYSNVDA